MSGRPAGRPRSVLVGGGLLGVGAAMLALAFAMVVVGRAPFPQGWAFAGLGVGFVTAVVGVGPGMARSVGARTRSAHPDMATSMRRLFGRPAPRVTAWAVTQILAAWIVGAVGLFRSKGQPMSRLDGQCPCQIVNHGLVDCVSEQAFHRAQAGMLGGFVAIGAVFMCVGALAIAGRQPEGSELEAPIDAR